MATEKIITVGLRKVFDKPVTKRAKSALFVLKKAITKETRKKDIKISNKVNEAIWSRGLFKSPRRITVKVIIDEDAKIYLPDEEIPKAKTDKKAVKEEVVSKPKAKETKTEKKPVKADKEEAKTEKKAVKVEKKEEVKTKKEETKKVE